MMHCQKLHFISVQFQHAAAGEYEWNTDGYIDPDSANKHTEQENDKHPTYQQIRSDASCYRHSLYNLSNRQYRSFYLLQSHLWSRHLDRNSGKNLTSHRTVSLGFNRSKIVYLYSATETSQLNLVRKSLHWLKISERREYKVLSLNFETLQYPSLSTFVIY